MKVGDLVKVTRPRVGVGVGTLGMILAVNDMSGAIPPRYVVEIPGSGRNPMTYLAEHIEVINESR